MLRNIENFANSDKYRSVIHDLIPGGAHTYSKGDDQFPVLAPAAIDHGKGSHVWDIDGNEFLDCSMGLTSVSLGHAYEPVLEAVQNELVKV
jgi:glutamate-1-semialdehyde aminotransferase